MSRFVEKFLLCVFFPLSFLRTIRGLSWKKGKSVEWKKRILKESPELNSEQLRFQKGRTYRREVFLNQFYRIWIPIRVRLEFYTTGFRLAWSLIKNWIAHQKAWLFYEWKVYGSQWVFFRKNSFFFSVLFGSIWVGIVGLLILILVSFLFLVQPWLDTVGIFFFSESFWLKIKGFSIYFIPWWVGFFLWLFWFFFSLARWSTEKSEDLTEKFHNLDLFDEWEGDRFYRRVKMISKELEDKDDFFIYDGGFRQSEWEEQLFGKESRVTADQSWKGEVLWKKYGSRFIMLTLPNPFPVEKKGLNVEDFSWKDLLEKSGNLIGWEEWFSKAEGRDFIGEEEVPIFPVMRESGWDRFRQSVFQLGFFQDERSKRTYFWEPELDWMGGRHGDSEDERNSLGIFQYEEDEETEFIDLWLSRRYQTLFEEDHLFSNRVGLSGSNSWSENQTLNLINHRTFWLEEYMAELIEMGEGVNQRESEKKVLESEYNQLKKGNWGSWVYGMESWFDDPLELIWMGEYQIWEEWEEEEDWISSYQSTANLDNEVGDLRVQEALAMADYWIMSMVVISYLCWNTMPILGRKTDPRLKWTSESDWIKPSRYPTNAYLEFIKDKRKKYVDPYYLSFEQSIQKKYHFRLRDFFDWQLQNKVLRLLDWFGSNITSFMYIAGSWVREVVPIFGMVKEEEGEEPQISKKSYKSKMVEKKVRKNRQRRQLLFVRNYLNKGVRNVQGLEDPPYGKYVIPELPGKDWYVDGPGRANWVEELSYGYSTDFDFLKNNYQMELYQIREGIWSITDVCFTFWGTTLRIFRIFGAGLVGLFGLLLDWCGWGFQIVERWYFSYWWPLIGTFFWKGILLPIGFIWEVWFRLVQECFHGNLFNGPPKISLLSIGEVNMDPNWVKSYFLYWEWDPTSFSFSSFFPKYNVLLYRGWWGQLHENFFLVPLVNGIWYLIRYFCFFFYVTIKLFIFGWNLQLYVWAFLLEYWIWWIANFSLLAYWFFSISIFFFFKVFVLLFSFFQ